MTSHYSTTFGDYIRRLRKEKGYTLTQLAARLNLDSANLSKIENSKREFDEKRLDKLATIFNKDVEEIKLEYYSDKIASRLLETEFGDKLLVLAKKKVENRLEKSI